MALKPRPPRDAALAAEALGGALPPLLVAAERVAATVAQGVHGRRRTGRGDSFWQYRPFAEGDAAQRVDWRQSARSDRLFVRETEWEAAQTVYLWVADGDGMRWHSPGAPPKRDRATLLTLALASLLLRAGEHVRRIRLRAAKRRPRSRHCSARIARASSPYRPNIGSPATPMSC